MDASATPGMRTTKTGALRRRLHVLRLEADLADRLGAVREQLRPVPYDPLRSPDTARLLVREEREHDVARRGDVVGDQVAQVGQHHADHVLHVDRAPPVQHPVDHVARERVVAPVGGVRGDDVEVSVHCLLYTSDAADE